MKEILIVGANSYIGNAVESYLNLFPNDYSVTVFDAKNYGLSVEKFEGYDVVFCVTGIAHVKETNYNRNLYYSVNRDLVVNIAKYAKEAKVKQFILLSSMAVYGKTTGYIKKDTIPTPNSAYGDSKLQADMLIHNLSDSDFRFVCLRPPMIYGYQCKGNYQLLRRFALISPIFPDYLNQRSMLYIGNLCVFIKKVIDMQISGLYFPQNNNYVQTSKMVVQIARCHNKRIRLLKAFNVLIKHFHLAIFDKVFGSLKYEPVDLIDEYSFEESIVLSEGEGIVKY